jgi:trk system potassium uptake protein TrkA
MKVVICGAGQVGFNIARQLSRENNDVTVVDQSAELVRRISDSLDVTAVLGQASHPDVLERVGTGDADMLIAVTYADEVNMVACQVAHTLFNVPTKIARVRSQSYLDPIWADLYSSDHLPIDVIISPEIEVARAITRRFDVPGSFDVISVGDGKLRLIGVRCQENCPIVNTPLRQLTRLFPDLDIIIVGITRGTRTIVPTGDDQLLVDDDVYFVVDSGQTDRAMAAFGHEEAEAQRILIIGGGHIGLFLAEQLETEYPHVNAKIIESDSNRVREIAQKLKKTTVLYGDARDLDLLQEANIAATETVVAVTNDDETNILSSLLAKQHGAQRAVTLINTDTYNPLIGPLGIDAVVNPRSITVSTILQHVRRGRIRAVHSLGEGVGEVVEAEALETSSLVGQPLRDINLPGGVIIGAVLRGGEVIIPRGATVIQAKDHVVLFTRPDAVKKVERMFSVRLEYF